MVIEGPTLENPIPQGSIIVCPTCWTHIGRTDSEVTAGIIMIKNNRLSGLGIRLGQACPKCSAFVLRHNRKVFYMPPPTTLGDQILNFMYWDENNAANR